MQPLWMCSPRATACFVCFSGAWVIWSDIKSDMLQGLIAFRRLGLKHYHHSRCGEETYFIGCCLLKPWRKHFTREWLKMGLSSNPLQQHTLIVVCTSPLSNRHYRKDWPKCTWQRSRFLSILCCSKSKQVAVNPARAACMFCITEEISLAQTPSQWPDRKGLTQKGRLLETRLPWIGELFKVEPL